jgi:ribosome-associated protein
LEDLIKLIEDKKGMDVVVIDVEQITTIAKYIIIMTSTSMVHSNSLAKYIIDFFEKSNLNSLYKKNIVLNNPWILIDGSDIIANIFLKETREFYSLEKIFFKGKIIHKSDILN